MSVNTWKNLEGSEQTSNNNGYDGTLYDGSQTLEQAWFEGLKPDAFMTISEWSDEYRVLSPKSAAEPGLWRTERTPYLREIMDQLSPHKRAQRVVFMKGAQIGGTEAGNNWIGYVIHMAPGPMMAVAPTVEMAKRNSKQRIDPLLEDSTELSKRVKPARSRDSGNTVLSKEFPGGVLVMTGANSAVGLRSMPARYLFMDEVDGYPGDVEGEGDPIMLAERRSATFQGRRKVFLVSTPTLKGVSRIAREFEHSDQRYFHVPCPHCGHEQPLRFTQLRWEEGYPSNVSYQCESCDKLIAEHHKTEMLENGRWVTSSDGDGITVGYHLSSLYSPVGWFSWSDAAAMFEQAKEHPELMKSFVNTVLGEPFEEDHDAPEWERLYERAEDYAIGTVPEGGLFLTAGVDIQRDRIEAEIVAWGLDKHSWSVDYRVFYGDIADPAFRETVYGEITGKQYRHASGASLSVLMTAVDSGYATQEVYDWVRKKPVSRIMAVKGQNRSVAPLGTPSKVDVTSKGKKLRRGVRVWPVGVSLLKSELYNWLNLTLNEDGSLPNGYCHFPKYDIEFFKQLTAEQLITRIVKGYPKREWQKTRDRNEALDCRIYARAAAIALGVELWSDNRWQKLQAQLMGESKPSNPDRPQSAPSKSITRNTRRRKSRSSIMG